jgi:hypothetical protein
VDAWTALVKDRANLAQAIEQDAVQFLESRGLEGLSIYRDQVSLNGVQEESQENLVIYQDLGKGMHATVILRVAERDTNDLEIAWRLFERFERNTQQSGIWGASQATLLVVGFGVVALAVLFNVMRMYILDMITCCFGVTMMAIALSWGLMELRNRAGRLVSDEGKSLDLGNTVDRALRQALVNNGINVSEVSVK